MPNLLIIRNKKALFYVVSLHLSEVKQLLVQYEDADYHSTTTPAFSHRLRKKSKLSQSLPMRLFNDGLPTARP